MSAYVAWLFLAGALAAPDDGNASYDEVVDFTVPWDLDADRYDALLEDAAGRAPVGSRQVRLLGWGEYGVLRPLDAYLPVLPSPEDKDPWEGQRAADHPGPTPGALSG